MAERVIEIVGLRKSYGDVEAVAGIDLSRRPRRGVRAARTRTAPARRRPPRSSRGTWRPRPATTSVLGHDPAKGEQDAQAADRHRPAVHRRRPVPDGARDDRDVRRLLPATASDRRGHRGRRSQREDRRARPTAQRRPAASPRRRDRARRRPGAAVPRRADDRVRPERASQRVGDGQEPRRRSARPCGSRRTSWTRRSTSPTGSP